MCGAGVPYDLTPEFLEELFAKHKIDYVVHGDDPCLLPDGTDAYAHAKQQGRFRMVHSLPHLIHTNRPTQMNKTQARVELIVHFADQAY